MFNFLDSKFAPKVNCSAPSTDNYEVDNLISSNYLAKMRGYISYPTSTPPVEIEFEFLCSLNIHYINLNTTVGNHKCNGIELFARTENSSYVSIGKRIFEASGIVFCNSRKYSKCNLPPNVNSNFELAFLKSNTAWCFLNATSLKVCIFRTNKSVPCIGSVEVWGTPSRKCSKVTKETVAKIASRFNKEVSISQDFKTNEFKIPEDFKDDLTCELMTLPMTLPSGKTVDQTTLEKHIENEKSFGRKPGDPFTGINFNDSLKPVLNVALKSRIDMFLLQKSHMPEFFNLKRTLGGGTSNTSQVNLKKRSYDSIQESQDGSLDGAISKAKRNIHFKNFATDEVEKSKCCVCKTALNYLYQLPCAHFYCRSCLLTVCQTLICSICQKQFIKNDVKKCNF